ncbi:MAG TPA: trypsin-like peptidase domain-containing protein [Candidatus Saccharimonadales bacterium]|nr:trypsin-like peptidase domain-containing protein [Candidatus Saccharimonadales bacterium]
MNRDPFLRAVIIPVLTVATLALAACRAPQEHGPEPTSGPSVAATTPSPTPTRFELPALAFNLQVHKGTLIPCFIGGLAVPKNSKVGNDQHINADIETTEVASPDLKERIRLATVKVQIPRPNTGIVVGTGTIIAKDKNNSGYWVASAAHLALERQNLKSFSVIDANGATHTPDSGCYVYNRNGQPAPLSSSGLPLQGETIDDVMLLHVTGTPPGLLPLANTNAPYGEPLFFGGYPLRGDTQSSSIVYSTACIQAFERDDTLSAHCVAAFGQGAPGHSGSGIIDRRTYEVVGVLDEISEKPEDPAFLGVNHVVATKPTEIVGYTPVDVTKDGLAAAEQQLAAQR